MPNPYVTEAYLQKQVEQHAALQIGRVMLDLAFGYGPDIAHVVGAYPDPDYVKNGRINVSVRSKVKRWRHGKPVYVHEFGKWFSVDFDAPVYDTSESGIFNAGPPHILDDGRVSTGEYTTVDNQTSEPVEHEIEKTVEESDSSSISMSESLELKSGTTVEAGTDTAKVSETLEATFGISKESTSDHATTVGETISDKLTVDPGEKLVVSLQRGAGHGGPAGEHRRPARLGAHHDHNPRADLWLGAQLALPVRQIQRSVVGQDRWHVPHVPRRRLGAVRLVGARLRRAGAVYQALV